MKKIITLLIVSVSIYITAHAQITFTRSDYGNFGDKVIYAIDTSVQSSITIGASGANKTWNFKTGLYADNFDSSLFIDASTNPNAPVGANIILRSASNGDQYAQITSNFLKIIYDDPNYNISGVKLTALLFPMSYQTNSFDTAKFSVKGIPADFGYPPITGFDSVRADITINIAVTCDGWGTLILPDSSSHSSLRIKTLTNQVVLAYLHNVLTNTWTFVQNQSQGSLTYDWYAANSKSYLAHADVDTSTGNINSMAYKVNAVYPIIYSGIESVYSNNSCSVYPNPSNGQVTVQLPISLDDIEVKILDVTGKVVMTEMVKQNVNNDINIDVSHLQNGIYFVSAKVANRSYQSKLVLSK